MARTPRKATRKATPQPGSYLDQGRAPAEGATVWVVTTYEGVLKGTVARCTDIDGHGLGNTYVDVATLRDGLLHTPLMCVYDHQPRRVQVVDAFGTVTVWR